MRLEVTLPVVSALREQSVLIRMPKLSLPWRLRGIVAGLLVLATSGMAHAQITPEADPESRKSLETELARAEAQNRSGEAWLLKQRLLKGDFQDGDRIVVKLLGTAALMNIFGRPGTGTDTITVRAGKTISIPQMVDLSLEGVLRSELTEKLRAHLAQYLQDPSVVTLPLLRIAVYGQVGRIGTHYVPLDILLNDLIMIAGGPGPLADMDKLQIRRGGEVIWGGDDLRTALNDGISLERLHLRAGDELWVDPLSRGMFNWTTILQAVGAISGIFFTLNRIMR